MKGDVRPFVSLLEVKEEGLQVTLSVLGAFVPGTGSDPICKGKEDPLSITTIPFTQLHLGYLSSVQPPIVTLFSFSFSCGGATKSAPATVGRHCPPSRSPSACPRY